MKALDGWRRGGEDGEKKRKKSHHHTVGRRERKGWGRRPRAKCLIGGRVEGRRKGPGEGGRRVMVMSGNEMENWGERGERGGGN